MITKEFPINLMDHVLVPKHEIMSKEEVKKLINKYGILPEQLPWIRSTDPVVKAIGARPGDVIRIRRKSDTAGESIYYRYVVP
ncbi:MAG: DNA-directed RNA polymerase subunit H [Candidatus Asgardarchaeia archaeon]